MESTEMRNLWNSYVETNAELNIRLLERLNFVKGKSKLNKRMALIVIESIVHVFFIYLLAGYVTDTIGNFRFAVPGIILGLFIAASLAVNIAQLASIVRLDYGETVASLQEKIMKINIHTIQYAKIGLLTIPLYLCYAVIGFRLLGIDLYSLLNPDWWIANVLFTLILFVISIRLYRKINYENIHRRWVKNFVEFFGGKKLVDEMYFLGSLEEFKKV